ncbi:MAG: hypothetical protein QM742_09790 [Aquabacterium sp.]
MDGGAGQDVLDGGEGNDTASGGLGDDELTGGAGDDVLKGGQGQDSLRGGLGHDRMIFDIGDGHDVVYADADAEIVFTGARQGAALRVGRLGASEAGSISLSFDDAPGDSITLKDVSASSGPTVAFSDRTYRWADIYAAATAPEGTLRQGTAGADTLTGHHGDTLDGGAGDDLHIVGDGTVTVALGNDDGTGSGRDTLRWVGGGSSIVQLAEGLDADDLQLVWTRDTPESAGQWMLRLSQGRGELVLGNGTPGQGPDATVPGLLAIELADGRALSAADMQQLYARMVQAGAMVDGTPGNDALNAGVWQDNIVQGGEGNDTLTTGHDGEHADTLQGGAGDDVYLVGPDWGQDTVVHARRQPHPLRCIDALVKPAFPHHRQR